jgi:hypothetical protein
MPVQSINLHKSGKRHKVITSSSHREISERTIYTDNEKRMSHQVQIEETNILIHNNTNNVIASNYIINFESAQHFLFFSLKKPNTQDETKIRLGSVKYQNDRTRTKF